MSGQAASSARIADALFGRRSTLTLGIALFAALALLRAVVVSGVGDRLSDTRPEMSLRLDRDSPEVLASAALDAWQVRDARRATRLSLAALDRSPLNVHALRTLGLGLTAEGKPDQAAAVMRFAGTRGWRDDGVQAWLLRDDLAHRRIGEAFLHADALARRRTELWPPLFALFNVGAGDDASARAIADRLGRRPHWRESFLEQLARSQQNDSAVERMFQLVDEGPAPLNGSELSDYPRRLVGQGRVLDAFSALQGYRNGATLVGAPFDGDFAGRQGAPPFAWERLGKPGVDLDMGVAPDGAPHALRVDYDGYSATDVMRQLLAPAPGDYLLTGQVRPETGDAHILAWQVRCASDGRLLATTGAGAGASPNAWSRFAARFTVPAQGCDGVWLVLTETAQDHPASNVAWFTDLAVRPAAPAPGR